MSETKNDEQGASGALVDYSRPVGWWCPVCQMKWAQYPNTLIRQHRHAIIPRYLPLPTPEPVEVDEVETGEAEVVTFNFDEDDDGCWFEVATIEILTAIAGATK